MENHVGIEELPDTFTNFPLKANCASRINCCVAPRPHLPQTSLERWLKAIRTGSTKIQTFKSFFKVSDGTSGLVRRQLSRKKPAYGAEGGAEQREATEASFIKLWIN